MTANQINYAKHLEDVRSHRMNESIAERQAAASERQAYASEKQASTAEYNAYTQRINAESQRISSLAAQRSSLAAAMSAQASMSLAGLKQQELAESQRHNLAVEANTAYDTRVKKEVGYVSAGANILGTAVKSITGVITNLLR